MSNPIAAYTVFHTSNRRIRVETGSSLKISVENLVTEQLVEVEIGRKDQRDFAEFLLKTVELDELNQSK